MRRDYKREKVSILRFATLAVLLCGATESMADEQNRKTIELASGNSVVTAYMDSLEICWQKLQAYYEEKTSETAINVGYTTPNGRYYRLFMPLTFYHSSANSALSLREPDFGPETAVDKALMSVYLERPDLVVSSEDQLMEAGSIRRDFEVEVREDVEMTDVVDVPVPDESELVEEAEVEVSKPNFWTFKGDTNFQFLQNYFSDNWYAGGENAYSMVAALTLEANYNNKSKIKFENKLEMKLGIQSSQSDSVHKVKTNNDLLRYTGLFGIQATKKWYYSLQVLAYTQFSRSFESNDETVYSDWLSPLTVNVSLGMTYEVAALDGRLTGNVSLSPIAYNLKYVDRLALAEDNGIDEGHHSQSDWGSQVTADLTWKFNEKLSWKTRLYAYTCYSNTLFEWENTLNINIIKGISAVLFIHPRFDDSVERDDDSDSYWQFKEYCSLGFAYEF